MNTTRSVIALAMASTLFSAVARAERPPPPSVMVAIDDDSADAVAPVVYVPAPLAPYVFVGMLYWVPTPAGGWIALFVPATASTMWPVTQ